MQLNEYIENTRVRFEQAQLCFGHGTDNAYDEAVYLVFCSLAIDFDIDAGQWQQLLDAKQLRLLEDKVQRRISQKTPVAYLVGLAWFAGHEFYCDERALVPRSPIAELIGGGFQPLLKQAPQRILDMCAGGGCIGIACALEFTEAQVDLVDISEEALALASSNVEKFDLHKRVRLIRSNLFAQVDELALPYDLIVTNPPYVDALELEQLPAEFHQEPQLGLHSDDAGLELPLQILRSAADYLSEQGVLVMEVGSSSERLAERLKQVPLLWLEFEYGGDGVFSLTASQLREFRDSFI